MQKDVDLDAVARAFSPTLSSSVFFRHVPSPSPYYFSLTTWLLHRPSKATGLGASASNQQNGGVHPTRDRQHLPSSTEGNQAAWHRQHHRRHSDGTRWNLLPSCTFRLLVTYRRSLLKYRILFTPNWMDLVNGVTLTLKWYARRIGIHLLTSSSWHTRMRDEHPKWKKREEEKRNDKGEAKGTFSRLDMRALTGLWAWCITYCYGLADNSYTFSHDRLP